MFKMDVLFMEIIMLTNVIPVSLILIFVSASSRCKPDNIHSLLIAAAAKTRHLIYRASLTAFSNTQLYLR
jgi:hypothetical protein